jgi:quinol monooxygenase YgiN
MTHLANIVLLHAHDGRSALLGEALRELVARTLEEPGCLVCELNQSADNADLWMVYERWRGKDAFASHMQQSYVAQFLARLDELVSGPAEVRPFDYRGRIDNGDLI